MSASRTAIRIGVWLARLLTGAVFIASGWAKCVDPMGFVYKIEEYLQAWGAASIFPVQVIVILAVALSTFELITGVALLSGAFKRLAPVCGLVMMCLMLPLTLYVWIADPVADCGCFGDMLHISNAATFLKNLALTALLIYLYRYNGRCLPVFRHGLQWIALCLTGIYGITIASIGWNFQPIVDFRAYPVGSMILGEAGNSIPEYIYEKDGREATFSLDALPDSTWTFVGKTSCANNLNESLAIFDGDDEVTEDILGDTETDLYILVVSEPGLNFLAHARKANEICKAVEADGSRMIAVVAASGETLERWKNFAMPDYDVYSSSDTSLKEFARGGAALVAVKDGRIAWKRNMSTLDAADFTSGKYYSDIYIFDDGSLAKCLTGAVISLLILLWIISASSLLIRSKISKRTVTQSK